jgi:hypothetical protein
MRLTLLVVAALLAACVPPRRTPPVVPVPVDVATVPCEDAAPVFVPVPRVDGAVVPACESAECIRVALSHAQVVGLRRGATYALDGLPIYVGAGQVLAATGDETLPRPVLVASAGIPGGAIMVGEGASIISLDLRGPHYGRARFPVRLHEDWSFKAINTANNSGWTLADTHVEGWPSTGLLGVMASGVRVIGNKLARNGYSGLSLFPHDGDCGTVVAIVGNVLDGNGQNGMDACPSTAIIQGNVARWNGWGESGGDQNGLLHYSVGMVPLVDDVRVIGNRTCGNHGDGVRVHADALTGLWVEGNATDEGPPRILRGN